MAVIIDERDVGTVALGGEPPTPTGFLERHKEIKSVIDKKGYYNYQCVTPLEIGEELGISEDVVKEHIEVLKIDEAAVSVQKGDNPAICSTDGLQRLVDKLRLLRV